MKVVITIEGKKEEVQGLIEQLLDKEKEIKYVPTNPIVPTQPYSPTTPCPPYSPTWTWTSADTDTTSENGTKSKLK